VFWLIWGEGWGYGAPMRASYDGGTPEDREYDRDALGNPLLPILRGDCGDGDGHHDSC